MPKIFEADGFVIYFYPGEPDERHHLIHVHVYKARYGGDELVLQIPELRVLHDEMSTHDARNALEMVEENLDEIMDKTGQA